MIAYEFYTKPKNDGFIQIPVEYRNKVSKKVKVIILMDEAAERISADETKKLSFPYFAVDTTGYVFDREEANER